MPFFCLDGGYISGFRHVFLHRDQVVSPSGLLCHLYGFANEDLEVRTLNYP